MNEIRQYVLFHTCLLLFYQHFVGEILHVVCRSSLFFSLYEYSTIYLFILLLIDISVVPSLRLWWILLLYIYICISVKLLRYGAKQFSNVVVPICTPISSSSWFTFLLTLGFTAVFWIYAFSSCYLPFELRNQVVHFHKN